MKIIKKDSTVTSEFNSSTGKEKPKRDTLSSSEYKALILEKLNRAGKVEKNHLQQVDSYEVSRLIYKAGELKIEDAKELIVKLFEMNTTEENAFYYSVAWALGHYKEPKLRGIFEALREKLDNSSKYIVEEALFALDEAEEALHIEALVLPMPYRASLKNESDNSFVNQVKLLEETIFTTYQRYENADDYWDDPLRKTTKKELMPLLAQADELYLKFYILSILDKRKHQIMVKIIRFLPITSFNFSLFRRLYKMAEFREDQTVLAELITKIESKKMACYERYDYSSSEYKRSIGCSRLYFKKRSLRFLKNRAMHNEEDYIIFSKNILLSMNGYNEEFKAFSTEGYDNNWNLKTKKYDAFATHITFMSILYGAGKRYMLLSNKKMWETANISIKDEHRPEMHKELWNRYPKIALEILSKSSVEEVQKFSFAVVEENLEVIKNASLAQLLPMLNAHYDKAREFFFKLLKNRYAQSGEEGIVKTALFSIYPSVVEYALEMISQKSEILKESSFVADTIWKIKEDCYFNAFVKSLNNENIATNKVVNTIVKRLGESAFITEKARIVLMFKKIISAITIEHIEMLLSEEKISTNHYIALEIIRDDNFMLTLPLALKEKIAQYNDPEMLATTIYLLGKLSNEKLMGSYKMLVAFLYHKDKVVHKEAKKIVINLAEDEEDAGLLLKAIVEKTFLSATDEVADNVATTVKELSIAYGAVNVDQLYRMLIAKSKLALRVGTLILSNYDAQDFSVVQWARLAKNPNKLIRIWAYDAYRDNVEMVQKSMPKALMIFDTHWEDTREFAFEYFERFEPLSSDDMVVIADSTHNDVQQFAKQMIIGRNFDNESIMLKLSQHPALTIQKFVTDLMLAEMSVEQLLKLERFFNSLLFSVNSNRVAKTRVLKILNSFLDHKEVAQMYARLASAHSDSMVWADKTIYVEAMSYIKEAYEDITLPLSIVESEKREVV
jgi:hypothetical protein